MRLQTVIDLAAEYGAEVALITEQSSKAISQQDISFYRDEIADRDAKLAKQEELIETLRANNIAMRNNVTGEMDRVRAEYDEDIKFYREQLALLKDQLIRKDRYIDILIEVANKGGDLKAVEKIKGVE